MQRVPFSPYFYSFKGLPGYVLINCEWHLSVKLHLKDTWVNFIPFVILLYLKHKNQFKFGQIFFHGNGLSFERCPFIRQSCLQECFKFNKSFIKVRVFSYKGISGHNIHIKYWKPQVMPSFSLNWLQFLWYYLFFCEGILEKRKKVGVEGNYKTYNEFQLHQKVKYKEKIGRGNT